MRNAALHVRMWSQIRRKSAERACLWTGLLASIDNFVDIVCGNKVGLIESRVKANQITFHRKKIIPH